MNQGYVISTDKSKLDIDTIHKFLSTRSYWAKGRSRDTVVRSVENSMCFGMYEGEKLVGFARVVTDRAIFAFLMDVFVLETHRGRGLGKLLMAHIMSHPELQGLKRWQLGTLDAHGLYRQFGFTELAMPERHMEKLG